MVQNVQMSREAADGSVEVSKDTAALLAILDTACAKSVAGYPWFERYYTLADEKGIPWHVIDEVEQFQFGTSKVFQSCFTLCGWFAIAGRWFMVKVTIVPCDVPLLFSRPMLSKLGVKFDLANQMVSIQLFWKWGT